jgi:hypothetical protein
MASEKMVDRSNWGNGEWDNEPDEMNGEANGFPWAIRRGPCGHLCGYVGVPLDSPICGLDYDRLPVGVHGGLTYGHEGCAEGTLAVGWYWYGFDCAHCDDLTPRDAKWDPEHGFPVRGTYRNMKYVEGECWGLSYDLRKLEDLVRELINVDRLANIEAMRKAVDSCGE